jgi:hypothetical protein
VSFEKLRTSHTTVQYGSRSSQKLGRTAVNVVMYICEHYEHYFYVSALISVVGKGPCGTLLLTHEAYTVNGCSVTSQSYLSK